MQQSPRFVESQSDAKTDLNPIRHALQRNGKDIAKLTFGAALQHGGGYLLATFLADYLASSQMRGWADKYAYMITCLNLLLSVPTVIWVGHNVDMLGARRFVFGAPLMMLCLAPIVFYGLALSRSTGLDFVYQFMLCQILSVLFGSCFYWYTFSLLKDDKTRVCVYSIGYNLGAAMFSGTAVLIAALCVDISGGIYGMIWAGCWLSFLSLCTFITVIYVEYCEHGYDCIQSDQEIEPLLD